MRAYANDRELEGFLGRLQALKNKVVMQSEIDNEDVGERLAQLEELKRAALERRAANKKPKIGQEGMSEADRQIIEDAKVREKMNRAASKIQRAGRNRQQRQFLDSIKNQLQGAVDDAINIATTEGKSKGRGRGNPNWTPGSDAAKKAGSTGGRGKTKIEIDKEGNRIESKKKATKTQ